jgi:transposase
MQVLYERCAGLDVHQKTVVATVMLTASTGHLTTLTRTFGTRTSDLLALDNWLDEQQVTHVALESTGVYWYPVYSLLEGRRSIV